VIEGVWRFLIIVLIASLAGLGGGWFFLLLTEKSEGKERNAKRRNEALNALISSVRAAKGDAETSATNQITLALANLAKQRNRPAVMQYYDEIATLQGRRVREVEAFKKAGGKVVGFSCMFVPIELIHASGALPLRLDGGLYCTLAPSEQLLPSDACPVAKSMLGTEMLELSPYFKLCDVFVCPSSCDMKTKLADTLEDFTPIWRIEVPRYRDEPWTKRSWENEISSFRKNLERLTGQRITRELLKSSVDSAQEARTVFHGLRELRKRNPPPISGRDALLVTQATWYDDLERWTKKTRELCGELEHRIEGKFAAPDPDAPRIMLAGSPIVWPNWKLPSLIEECGAVIVCDELCTGDQGALSDPVNVDEWTMRGMMAAIADRYLLPITCPCFTPNDKRIDKIVRMVRDFHVDGVVYHQLRGCYIHKMEFNRIRGALKELGKPVLGIETDYTHEDLGQLRTRIEAFLEMIQSAKQAVAAEMSQ
jgi:benzoyl-CoA reductase/2-hydroxyglutaryl-CoA dehydratase subunit BcrC/BadD/HgdB